MLFDFESDFEKKACSLLEIDEGFLRGNMFADLYEPYKNYRPKELKPKTEREALLYTIIKICFAINDLNLYLDIYPDDRKAINLFNQYRKQKEGLMEEYESKYGPIVLNSDSLNKYPWAWDDMPWPWDN